MLEILIESYKIPSIGAQGILRPKQEILQEIQEMMDAHRQVVA